MNKIFKSISILPALLVLPAMADVITENTVYNEKTVIGEQAAQRGGAFEVRGAKIIFNEEASFNGNSATGVSPNNGYAGAVFIDGVMDKNNTAVGFMKKASFSDNTANEAGGAVFNQASLFFYSDVDFINNSANQSGALVGSIGSTTEFNGIATFDGNHAYATAGAISNAGTMVFNELAIIKNNYTETNQGTSVGNSGVMTFKNGLVVDSNGIESAGASTTGFGNAGTLNIIGGDISFTNNVANRYSGLYASAGNINISGVGIINFEGNRALGSSAGALGTHENSELTSLNAENIIFKDNSSVGNGYGGAIFSASNLNILGKNNTFSGNKSTTTGYGSKDETYYGGGAIHARSVNNDAKLIIGTEDSTNTFYKNTSNEQGGAIFVRNAADVTINGTTLFEKNSATKNGGAIYVRDDASKIVFNGDVIFKENTATKGGAIYNAGTLEIENASFHLNTATGNSGAIAQHDVNSVLKLKNVNFVENSADWGGAMVARGNVDIKGGSFEGNSSNDGGGAIYLATLINKGHKLSIDGTTFINNSTAGVDLDGGGAIGSFSDLVLKNAKFNGNHVDGLASNGGGAIFMGSVSTNDLSNVEFNSNTSATNGGAISMRFVDQGNNKDATLDIANTKFIENHADNFGGAIYNTLHNDKNDSGFVSISDTSFNSNTALNGGAIYNETYGTTDQIGGKISLSNVKFANNIASANGGAIYNAGTLVLSGTNEFSDNKAQNSANDIYNVGDLTIANGTTTIDGGIAGAGDLTIANDSTLKIGSAKINQNNITLNGTLIADLFADSDAFLTATQSFEGNGNLSVAVEKVGTYNIFGDKVFANAKNQITSSVFDLTWSQDGKSFDASLKSADKIVEDTGATKETVNAVLNIASSDSEQLKDLSIKMQEKLATHSKDDIAAVEDATKSVHPETESVVQSVATSVQTTVGNLAATRMSLPTIGRAGGDIKPTGAGFWANGLYNYTNQKDSFDGYTRGFAIGMDGVFNKVVTVGTGYSYSHSDIDSAHRDTEIDSYTMFVYGQYKPNQWYANAVLNYTISQYSETGSALGIGVKSDYDVHSFGGRIATGYDFANGVTPELGLRYTHIDADDYKNNLGVKHSLEDTDYMTLTLGGKYTRNFNTKHTHISFAPEFHGLLKYDVMSDDQVAVVTMPGVNSYSISGDKLSRFGAEFGVGLTMRYYNADWTLDYDLDVRDEYISHTGRIKWKYNF